MCSLTVHAILPCTPIKRPDNGSSAIAAKRTISDTWHLDTANVSVFLGRLGLCCLLTWIAHLDTAVAGAVRMQESHVAGSKALLDCLSRHPCKGGSLDTESLQYAGTMVHQSELSVHLIFLAKSCQFSAMACTCITSTLAELKPNT